MAWSPTWRDCALLESQMKSIAAARRVREALAAFLDT